jgi:hypothetical protein
MRLMLVSIFISERPAPFPSTEPGDGVETERIAA